MRKIVWLLVVFSFFSSDLNAQPFQWAKKFDSFFSKCTQVAVDNNFNVISAGTYRDSVDVDPGPNADFRLKYNNILPGCSYLSKLDSNGNFVWGETYCSTSFSIIIDLDIDNQNNIVVMGFFRDSIDVDFGAGTFWLHASINSAHDIFIAKYSPSGSLIWAKAINQAANTNVQNDLWCRSLKIDHDNNVILSGRYQDSVDFDPGPAVHYLPAPSPTNFPGRKFLLKLDSMGTFVWVLDWGYSQLGGQFDGNSEIDVDSANNIFIPLEFIDSLDIEPKVPSVGQRDLSLLKISPIGNLVWHKEIGSLTSLFCTDLSTDRWGNIFYAISTTSNYLDIDPGVGTHYLSWPSGLAFAILKLDNNGNFILAKAITSNIRINDICTDTLGGFCLNGRTYTVNNVIDLNPGAGVYNVNRFGATDVTVQKFDSAGSFVWGGIVGGTGNETGSSVCTDNKLGVYFTGNIQYAADLNPYLGIYNVTQFPGPYNGFVVKLNNCNKSESIVLQACDSVVYNNQVYFQDTVIQTNYSMLNTCDSTYSVVIDVKTAVNDTIQVASCNNYFWNNNLYTTTGFYTHNYGMPSGCDSIVTIDLSIHNDTLIALDVNECDSATVNGVTYYQNGQYQQQYINSHGCDSNYVINLTLFSANSAVVVTGTTSLQSTVNASSFQWIDCNTLQPIAGDTTAFFTATYSGSFACVITDNGCTDTSACFPITIAPDGVNDYSILSRLYPNPSTGTYQLELDKNYQDVKLEIRTLSGQLVWKKEYAALKETTIKLNEASGVYLLYIKQADHSQVQKVLKW